MKRYIAIHIATNDVIGGMLDLVSANIPSDVYNAIPSWADAGKLFVRDLYDLTGRDVQYMSHTKQVITDFLRRPYAEPVVTPIYSPYQGRDITHAALTTVFSTSRETTLSTLERFFKGLAPDYTIQSADICRYGQYWRDVTNLIGQTT